MLQGVVIVMVSEISIGSSRSIRSSSSSSRHPSGSGSRMVKVEIVALQGVVMVLVRWSLYLQQVQRMQQAGLERRF